MGVERARDVLQGVVTASAEEMLELALQLLKSQQFGLARKLLRRAREDSLPLARASEARQKHALCTYKDQDIPVSARLRKALEILEEGDDLATTTDQETLGIAGAIHKRRWEATTRVQDLEEALTYYHRGYDRGMEDDGYTAINVAFVLDLLADVEASDQRVRRADVDAGAKARRTAADEIRREIIERLAERGEQEHDNWWLHATLGEACIGLGRYSDAAAWLRLCSEATDVPEWQVESAVSQIGALCDLRARKPDGKLDPEAEAALEVLLGEHREAITTAHAGKVGVALSGGGFRASFFHIGVLAHLAELDMLRHVEVLSCVSGGSIVGAHYYLEVQRLLEAKHETEVSRDDYIEIVARVEDKFLAGVRKNIRMRVLGNPLSNLRAMLSSRWTRTHQAGRQYERHFYSSIEVGSNRHKRTMEDLLIEPKGEGSGGDTDRPSFNPKRDNWKRRCKVPILVINAATLNTGHNWQFTASWMGEPPAVVDENIDANPRLRRMYYDEAPRRWREVRLGDAVAASACVPGLFEPLVLDGLFDDMSVELVDGGVHDNQGVASLIEQECTVVIASDASGQMTCEDVPGRGPLSVSLRSTSVLSARVREAQLRDLLARRSSSALRGLMLVHLRKGLAEPPLNWIECPEPYDPADDVATTDAGAGDYGIPDEIQARLAGLRTDLDVFSDMEAYALMLSGYRMTERSFGAGVPGFPAEPGSHRWRFLDIADAVDSEGEERSRLMRVLQVGAERWLKVWRLHRGLRYTGVAAAIAAVVGLVYLLLHVRSATILTPGALLVFALLLAVAAAMRKVLFRRLEPVGLLARIAVGLTLVLAAPLALIQIYGLDRLYRRAGKVSAS